MELFQEPCPWPLAVILLVAFVVGLQWIANLPLGMTGAFVGVANLATRRGPANWQVYTFVGVLLGGLLHAIASGRFSPGFAHGAFDARFGDDLTTKAAILFFAGTAIGYGARTAGGCTSGNGICGTARLSPSSIAATATFAIVAIAVAHLVVRFVGGRP